MSDFELPPGSTTRSKKPAAEKQIDVSSLQAPAAEVNTGKKDGDAPKWSKEELNAIFDEIIFSNTYSEDIVIRNKLKVKFRTRTAEETESISLELDANPANLMTTIEQKRMLMNLQYSLVAYQGKELSMLTKEARVSFINKLPAPVIGALVFALSKFESKVYAACAEGEENF